MGGLVVLVQWVVWGGRVYNGAVLTFVPKTGGEEKKTEKAHVW